MQHPDYRSLRVVMELLENSPRLRRLVWAFWFVLLLWVIRWW